MHTATKEVAIVFAGIELTGVLGDVVYIVLIAAFFALCVLFVRGCAAIAGADPADVVEGGIRAVEAAPDLTAHSAREEVRA